MMKGFVTSERRRGICMKAMRKATILGANGAMGSGCGAILAAFGSMQVNMLARDQSKAEKGIQAAVRSVRSSVIQERMLAGSYDEDLEQAVSESDWVFECVAETYSIKNDINQRIAKARRKGTLVSTVSSGLSIARLAENYDDDGQEHYYGTHFFNPPYKLVLCELITHSKNNPAYTDELSRYLSNTLMRHVVITRDTPAFAGNRIGFQLMNEAAQMAEKYQDKGGIHLLDSLLSGYTGRAMSPLSTVDLVGLDVHKAIVDNIYQNTNDFAHATFAMPDYMEDLITKKHFGMKSGKGLYSIQKNKEGKKIIESYNINKKIYETLPSINIPFKKDALMAIRNSNYRAVVEIFKTAKGLEADLLRHFIARYISYSFSLVPEVTDQSGIDGAMGFGFNWLPASAWVDLLGGVKETCSFLENQKMPVPVSLSSLSSLPSVSVSASMITDASLSSSQSLALYGLQNSLDYRSLFKAS